MILDQFGSPISSPSPVLTRDTRPTAQPVNWTWAFDAAKQLGYKGLFWFPDLDPGEQTNEWTRDDIQRKQNWCYNNIGAVRLVIDGLALDEVDTGLWPKPATKNPAYNAKVKMLWSQQCGYHRSFSANGEDNFYSAQYRMRREINLRGECFGAKLRRGEAASVPQLHMIPSWQCRNADTTLQQDKWTEGMMKNALGRTLKYRFVEGNDARNFKDLDAADCIHFHDPFLIGQRRGMPLLAPVTRQMFRIDAIERTESAGVLSRSRIAYSIERMQDDDDGAPMLHPGATEVQRIKQDDGSTLLVQKIQTAEGDELDLIDLPKQRKVKIIESNHRAESSGWIKELLTQIAYCTKYPPDYIFALGGITQGTFARMVQTRVQRVLNTVRDFQIIMQLLEEWWPFWLWQNIAAGNLDDVRGGIPDEWWPYLVIRPRDLTVDPKSEGRLYDERVGTGKMPAGLYVGMLYGEDAEEFDDQIIYDQYRRRRRIREIAAELGEQPLEYDQVFRPPTGTTVVNDPNASNSTDNTPSPPPQN